MQTTTNSFRFASKPMIVMAVTIVIVAGIFASFFVGVRLYTGLWPAQSKSPSVDDKW